MERSEQVYTEALIHNKGLIYAVVNRFLHRGVEEDDLFQIASIGFLKAQERFDESLGLKFSTYAVPVMVGEIKRYLRDNGPVKVSRNYKTLAQKAIFLREQRIKETGIEPTVTELAGNLSITPEELTAALCAAQPPESLDKLYDSSQTALADTSSLETENNLVDRLALSVLIDALPEREKKLIYLRYIKELTQSQTAVFLGVSQVQISRMEKKILEKLRFQL